ncbi:MAG: type II toxin-antitoxin system RelE/ParE family toxin [Desulfuromonadaceae bacterium]|nr:type II toxin-antitoxin system RelE/ParE family toxin [Desulfuromonadaceae bacterium]MDD2854409.1 type II toxin-antitoxin system RelE/ParE family toxin [Desulfuromonadaceae bacterium]
MRVFKSKHFSRYARKEEIDDETLANAIREIESGLVDAVLGGGLVKKRVAREGSGKSSGYRTIIAFSSGHRSLFLYGFAKSDRDNIGNDELRELRKLSQLFLALKDEEITSALEIDRIEEIPYHDKTI